MAVPGRNHNEYHVLRTKEQKVGNHPRTAPTVKELICKISHWTSKFQDAHCMSSGHERQALPPVESLSRSVVPVLLPKKVTTNQGFETERSLTSTFIELMPHQLSAKEYRTTPTLRTYQTSAPVQFKFP
jgi:hypothetical protein